MVSSCPANLSHNHMNCFIASFSETKYQIAFLMCELFHGSRLLTNSHWDSVGPTSHVGVKTHAMGSRLICLCVSHRAEPVPQEVPED